MTGGRRHWLVAGGLSAGLHAALIAHLAWHEPELAVEAGQGAAVSVWGMPVSMLFNDAAEAAEFMIEAVVPPPDTVADASGTAAPKPVEVAMAEMPPAPEATDAPRPAERAARPVETPDPAEVTEVAALDAAPARHVPETPTPMAEAAPVDAMPPDAAPMPAREAAVEEATPVDARPVGEMPVADAIVPEPAQGPEVESLEAMAADDTAREADRPDVAEAQAPSPAETDIAEAPDAAPAEQIVSEVALVETHAVSAPDPVEAEPVEAEPLAEEMPPLPQPRPERPRPREVARAAPETERKARDDRPRPAPQSASRGPSVPLGQRAGGKGDKSDLVGRGARSSYSGRVLAHLERTKRYPRAAEMRRLSGVVTVSFTLNGDGSVTGSRIARSSGHAVLDEEVAAMLQRAVPFPRIPDELGRSSMSFTVPIQFMPR